MEGDIEVTILMVASQVLEVGLSTFVKAATNNGMSDYVFVVYSNAMAVSFLLPSSFLYYRKRPSLPISTSIISRIFLLSLISCAAQTLIYTGIGFSSPVLNSVMSDLSPVFTMFLAIVFRYEKLDVREVSSYAKCIGTVLSIAGASMVTLYRSKPNNRDGDSNLGGRFVSHDDGWILGGILLALGSFCVSLNFNVKTWIMKEFPEVMVIATISCSFVVALSAIVAFVVERDNPQAWIVKPDMELAAILYSGIVVVVARNIVHIWACGKKGPLYVAMFNPLGMVIALAMGLLFLGESFSLASVIGCGIISIGFYGVLWGQAQQERKVSERKVTCNYVSSSSSDDRVPLLRNSSV